MNTKRFLISCIVVFAFIFGFEWLFHGKLIHGFYEATPSMWRLESEMQNYCWWLTGGLFLLSVFFCYIFTKGYENKGIGEGVRYGLIMGLFLAGPAFITYAVQPLPLQLIMAWVGGGLFELAVSGILVAAIYKPANA